MKKFFSAFLLTLALVMLFSSCEPKDNYVEATFVAMDTVINIKIAEDEYDETAMLSECERIIKNIENVISKTVYGSFTSYTNDDVELIINIDPIFEEVIGLSLEYSALTNGSFDITIGSLKELWEICALEGREPYEGEIALKKESVGYDMLTIEDNSLKKERNDIRIDLGAIGKGYAAQKVCDYLTEAGARSAIMSFGGNVALVGEKKSGKPYVVGIKDPKNTSDVVGYLSLEGGFVSVSGDYERYIEIGNKKYNHIIDPVSGKPSRSDIHSVSVICNSDDGALADALSTALFVMGKDKAMEFYNSGAVEFEAVIITDEGIFMTDGIKDKYKEK